MDGFLGEIRAFGFNFVPRGWMQCNGALLSISQYTALFAVVGTNFGGNGTSTFALPNYGGSALLGRGQGPGLSNYEVGDAVGTESVSLTVAQMPMHGHAVHGSVLTGVTTVMRNVPTATTLVSRLLTTTGTNQAGYVKAPLSAPTTMAPGVIGVTGSSTGHENRQPLLALMVCICSDGVFPQRN